MALNECGAAHLRFAWLLAEFPQWLLRIPPPHSFHLRLRPAEKANESASLDGGPAAFPDPEPAPAFDELARLAAAICHTPIAAHAPRDA